jgi:hypothetical protein
MLEWKPRLLLLLVAVVGLAQFLSVLQIGIGDVNFGW